MANRNTKRARKQVSREFAAARKDGGQISSPPSRRRSKWKGVPPKRTVLVS